MVHKQKIIGLVGFISSGKNTVADIISNDYGYQKLSFADSLKSAVSSIFNWDRELLEGITEESRAFREKKDEWWSNKLGKSVTPRWVLQYMGTEVLRNNFHNDIWIMSILKKIETNPTTNFIITDTRFINEIKAIESIGGSIIRVKRGNDPVWFEDAKLGQGQMIAKHPTIHESEWNWIQAEPKIIINNDGSITDLMVETKKVLKEI